MARCLVFFMASEVAVASPSQLRVTAAAVETLKNCQFGLAERLAIHVPSPLRESYRLAWYNLTPIPELAPLPGASEIRWRWDGELWSDEIGLFPPQTCKQTSRQESDYPAEYVDEWYETHAPRYLELPSSARETLRWLKYASLMKTGRARAGLPISTGPSSNSPNAIETCELRGLKGVEEDNASIAEWLIQECFEVKSRIVGIARVRAADGLPRTEANVPKILSLYRWAQRDFSEDINSTHFIGYRIAVVATLRPKEADIFYRSAVQAIVSKALPESFENILRQEICKKLGTSASQDNFAILTKVFSGPEGIIQDLVVPCIEDTTRSAAERTVTLSIARRLLEKIEIKVRRRVLAEQLFELALKHSKTESISFSQLFASSSLDKEVMSAVIFWKGVSKPQSVWAKEAVSEYRKSRQWSDLDELRFDMFRSKQKGSSKSTASKTSTAPAASSTSNLSVLDENSGDARLLDLADLRPLPPFTPQVELQLDFSKIFFDEAGAVP